MSDQDDTRGQVDAAEEDIELPQERSEEVKGGIVIWKGTGAEEDFAPNRKI